MLSEFKKFVLRGNVVDLAVAVVVGVAFTAMITAFVADLITPLIAAILGKPSFSNLSFELHGSTFKYGSFLNALLSFLIVATIVFFAVVVPLGALMKRLNLVPKDEPKARDAAVPRVSERHPGRGAPLRVLHDRVGGGGLAVLGGWSTGPGDVFQNYKRTHL
jgi:large conductance mechanosensitive channel